MEVYIEWLEDRIYAIESERNSESHKQKRIDLNNRLRELRLCLKNAINCR